MYEKMFKLCSAGVGGIFSYLYGGWSFMLQALVFFVISDYITGVMASAIEGKLSSTVGMKGIAKKVFIFIIVAAAHQADIAIGNGSILMDMTVFFYLANEFLSILENTGRAGVPYPEVLKQAVDILKGKTQNKQ
jgi:toxin secretion/phage lysis holin